MSRLLPFLTLAFALGCENTDSDPQYGICADVCKELYQNCSYSAYPSYDSCLEGCAYNQEEGADIEQQLTCFLEAECDTFEIIECENQYGANNDE